MIKAMRVFVMKLFNVLAVCTCLLAANIPAVAEDDNMQVFKNCLSELGGRLDCYFAVESIGRAGSLNNPILDALVNIDASRVQSVDDLVAFLTNEVRIVWKDKCIANEIRLVTDRVELNNKAIIRIRDAKLLNIVGYSLTNKTSLDYEGNIDGLLNLLSNQDSLIQPQKVNPIGMGPIRIDVVSHVESSVTNMAVRDLLTSCIPIAGYNRIVWSSYTDGKAESPVVTVKFYGKE